MTKFKVDGEEFEYCGLTEDRRGIIVPSGIIWTFPWVRTSKAHVLARPVDRLEPYAPSQLHRVTFDYPDLTPEFPHTVVEAYERQRTYHRNVSFDEHVKNYPDDRAFGSEEFEQARQRIVAQPVEEYARSREAKTAVWQKHGSNEMAAKHGYQGLAFELKIQESLKQLGYSREAAVQEIARIKYLVRYNDPDETVIYLKGIQEEAHPPSRGAIETKLDAIQQSVNAIGEAHYEVQRAKERLEKMQGEKLFAFVSALDSDSFRVLCGILAHGTVAKASRALNVSDSTLRSKIKDWKGRGGAYHTAWDLVQWRKKMATKGIVPLNQAITSGTAANVDFEGLLADVFEELLEMTVNNWDEKADTLVTLLRPYATLSKP
jgi:hypothetical protein